MGRHLVVGANSFARSVDLIEFGANEFAPTRFAAELMGRIQENFEELGV
jgi:hypothetical protein